MPAAPCGPCLHSACPFRFPSPSPVPLPQTVGERVFATNFEFWDANEQAQKTVGHFKAQTAEGMDVVLHVVSLRDKFFPLALERQVRVARVCGVRERTMAAGATRLVVLCYVCSCYAMCVRV